MKTICGQYLTEMLSCSLVLEAGDRHRGAAGDHGTPGNQGDDSVVNEPVGYQG